MKKINQREMKVGDFIYLDDNEKPRNERFIVKIIKLGSEVDEIDWWRLSEKPKDLFELSIDKEKEYNKGKDNLDNEDWEGYNLFKLNKKEILEFKKHLILKNL